MHRRADRRAGMGALMAGIKDGMEAMSPLPVQNNIAQTMADLSFEWRKSVERANGTLTTHAKTNGKVALTNDAEQIFSSPQELHHYVQNGVFLGDLQSPRPSEASDTLRKALVAAMLPLL